MTVASIDEVLRRTISDADLEDAAEETAAAYTYQTSAYSVCCN